MSIIIPAITGLLGVVLTKFIDSFVESRKLDGSQALSAQDSLSRAEQQFRHDLMSRISRLEESDQANLKLRLEVEDRYEKLLAEYEKLRSDYESLRSEYEKLNAQIQRMRGVNTN